MPQPVHRVSVQAITCSRVSLKRQRPEAGDIFGVPLPNGALCVGQVLARERQALNSIGCAFYCAAVRAGDSLAGIPELLRQRPIAILLTTPDLLNKGHWPILGRHAIQISIQEIPYERFRSKAWVGAKINGSGIVEDFLAAFFGLAPWDEYKDPNYLDGLLLPGRLRPDNVVLSKKQG